MIKIYPYYGAGDIKLGADITTTRASFGNEFSTSTYGDLISDYFDKSKIQVEYKNGIVVFIGVNYPLEVEYNGVNLSGLDYDAIYKLFLNESRERFGDGNSLVFWTLAFLFILKKSAMVLISRYR